MSVDPVLIIGAGPAGLAVAAELASLGVPSRVIERADRVGSSWRSRYDCLQLNTSTWMSTLRSGDRFARGVPVFPSRDQVVSYLESFAERHAVDVRFGVEVTRIDPGADGWRVSTAGGEVFRARQVVVAIGAQHTPSFPDWPGRERFGGQILHSFEYHNAVPFAGQDVVVVGGGCSGLDIARDLAQGGARSVHLAVKTQPMLLTKSSLGVPTDVLVAVLYRLPVRIADVLGRLVQRVTVGDLSRWGLEVPAEGIFTRLHRGKVPTVISPGVIAAVRAGDFGVVPGVVDVGVGGVQLMDGRVLEPDVVIAATGFGTGLESLVGHLGCLGSGGAPVQFGGVPVAPGLRFIGYNPCMGVIRRDARRVCGDLFRELTGAASEESAGSLSVTPVTSPS